MRPSTTIQHVVRLNAADLPAVQRLYAEEAAGLPEGFLQVRGEPELLGFLDGSKGQAFGVLAKRGLQAVALLRLPDAAAFAGQPAFPFVPAGDWPQRAAFLESTLVRRWARGHGSQLRLIRARVAAAEAAGRRWLCAGVHRENVQSWHNLLRSGLMLVGCRTDSSPARFGFLRPLNGAALTLRPQTVLRVRLDDLAGLQDALASGLVGAGVEEGERLLFRQPAQASVLSTGAARAA